MGDVLISSAASLSISPAELILLIVCIVLFSLRAWSGVLGVTLARGVSQLLTSATTFLVVLFLVLVVIRFKALG